MAPQHPQQHDTLCHHTVPDRRTVMSCCAVLSDEGDGIYSLVGVQRIFSWFFLRLVLVLP